MSLFRRVATKITYLLPMNFVSSRLYPRKLVWGGGFQRLFSEFFTSKSGQTIQNIPFKKAFNETGFGNNILLDGAWGSIREATDASVAGYVPYIRDKTILVLYNFFSVNYGLRKQLLGNVILIRDKQVVKSVAINLEVYGVNTIDLKDLFKGESGDVVLVELFHPRIPKGHAGHDGHLRFWGVYGNECATVHSMPFPLLSFFDATVRSSRAVFAINRLENDILTHQLTHYSKQAELRVDGVHDAAEPLGYYVSTTTSGDPAAVWHAAEYTGSPLHYADDKRQVIAFPPISGIDAQLNFLEALADATIAKVILLDSNGHQVANQTMTIAPQERYIVSDIFLGIELAGCSLVVDFTACNHAIHSGYVHIFYMVGKRLGDCVHSHRLEATALLSPGHDDYTQTIPKKRFSGSQALKFMHFPVSSNVESYLSVWTLDEPVAARLRYFSSDRKEFIDNIVVPTNGVEHIDVSKRVKDLGVDEGERCIVQFQSLEANLNCSQFTYDRDNKTIAVDHLTGG